MLRVAVLLSLLLLLLDSAASVGQEKKVRLFLLSGQSNMAGLNPDASFTPIVKKAFPDDEVSLRSSVALNQ